MAVLSSSTATRYCNASIPTLTRWVALQSRRHRADIAYEPTSQSNADRPQDDTGPTPTNDARTDVSPFTIEWGSQAGHKQLLKTAVRLTHMAGPSFRSVALQDDIKHKPTKPSRANVRIAPGSLPWSKNATGSLIATAQDQVADPLPSWHTTQITLGYKNIPVCSMYLRDLCQCPQCVDPSSKQRNFLTADIPSNIVGEVMGYENNSVKLKWHNDVPGYDQNHITVIPLSVIATPDLEAEVLKPWLEAEFTAETTDIPFDEYMQSDSTLYKVLRQLKLYGLAFITNVPESTESVSRLAERIGPIRHTLYGTTWDVRSVPDATNVAYTAKDLGFHMDLLPLKEAPALQLLHCIRSSAKGGNSLFMDAHRAAADLWAKDPSAFKALCKHKVRFHYDHPETHIYKQLKTVLRPSGYNGMGAPQLERPMQIAWSPPFQAPFPKAYTATNSMAWSLKETGTRFAEWTDAAKKFNQLIHKPEGICERLMKPGECVIFHNTRVLHARTAFDVDDAGKERWLHGAYVDADAWDSKMRVLEGQSSRQTSSEIANDAIYK